ncbi:hypothetical protein NCC78_02140 [Micromonospora phytophila]|uniref:hypothetical protein n=1 Tax=Micromonospora phytophila TaxID=709888 RepID=UPI0020307E98|nr:hypothetical protein [Micromonospora phytophila]MCM0673526.1 hypothetical protein [Micromonospora phytophila]
MDAMLVMPEAALWPRARSNNAQPLEAAPSVKQLDGLTCAMKVPTSAGDHLDFPAYAAPRRDPETAWEVR